MAVAHQLYPVANLGGFKLPKCLSMKDRYRAVVLHDQQLRAEDTRTETEETVIPAVVKADRPIPKCCSVYYFEVTIASKCRAGIVAVGVCSAPSSLNKLPGMELTSYGYHSNDGKIYHNSLELPAMGPSYGEKDVIGCGVNFVNNGVFFTKNGVLNGPVTVGKKLPHPVYPCVALACPGGQLALNFGHCAFSFDISGYMTRERASAIGHAVQTKCSDTLAHVTMKEIVAAYLVHHGYLATWQTFANRWCPRVGPGSEPAESVERRRQLRRMLLDARYLETFAYLEQHYPGVLVEHPEFKFLLQCRQFIEMLCQQFCTSDWPPPNNSHQQTASWLSDSSVDATSCKLPASHPPQPQSRTNGAGCKRPPPQPPLRGPLSTDGGDSEEQAAMRIKLHHPQEHPHAHAGEVTAQETVNGLSAIRHSEEMEIDGAGGAASAGSNENADSPVQNGHNKAGPTPISPGEASLVPPSSCTNQNSGGPGTCSSSWTGTAASGLGLHQLVEYGRQLRQLAGELEKEKVVTPSHLFLLKDAFSLVAYHDPYASPFKDLLDTRHREELSSMINSAILEHLNQPRVPVLETALAQLEGAMATSSGAGSNQHQRRGGNQPVTMATIGTSTTPTSPPGGLPSHFTSSSESSSQQSRVSQLQSHTVTGPELAGFFHPKLFVD